MSLIKQVQGGMSQSAAVAKFNELKARVETVKQKRSEKKALLEMYKNQYNKLVQQVKEQGIEKVSDLPAVIKAKEDELLEQAALLEERLQQAEAILSGQ